MKQFVLISSLTLYSIALFGQEIFTKDNVAIRGYDAVAYFKQQKPVEGSNSYKFDWSGATWKFSSSENLEAFKADPQKFAPQFGGYCAYGVSDGDGHKSPTSPEAFTIVDGKLYLNYNLKVKELWSKDRSERILTGDKNWKKIKTSTAD
jgi:YHS domain-containing protein